MLVVQEAIAFICSYDCELTIVANPAFVCYIRDGHGASLQTPDFEQG